MQKAKSVQLLAFLINKQGRPLQATATSLNEPHENCYRAKITSYGDGLGEIAFWYDSPLGREQRSEALHYPSPRLEKPDPVDLESNQERAFRRAKSKVRKLVMTIRADRLLTFTTRENITDRTLFDKLFVRVVKLIHEKYPEWKYVAVAERQKRGAWHYHLAVTGFQDVGFIRAAWLSLVDGNIDVTAPRTGGDKKAGAASIAGYLTKYMSKAFIELYEFGKYRYRASQGIELNTCMFWMEARNFYSAQKEAAEVIHVCFEGVGCFYFSDDWSHGWLASWSLGVPGRSPRTDRKPLP